MHNAMPAFRRPVLLLALAAAGLAATGTLLAAPANAPHGRFLQTADANGDGAVSADEFDAVRATHLARLDGDNDGFVTFDEHKAAREARAREYFLARHDSDGDGRVSLDEMADRGDGRFERMDRNRDGAITGDELRHRHHHGDARRGHATRADGGR